MAFNETVQVWLSVFIQLRKENELLDMCMREKGQWNMKINEKTNKEINKEKGTHKREERE